jgi:Holliday junction resolvase
MKTSGRKGTDYERAYRKQLELDGYVVVRSAASKGPFDLIAWKPFYEGLPLLFIQMKASRTFGCKTARAVADSLRTFVDGYTDVKTVVIHPQADVKRSEGTLLGVRFHHHYG